jgi:hypothetical protein
MLYKEARRFVLTGDVFLFEGHSWFSWLIRHWTKRAQTHAAIAIWMRVGRTHRLCLFESMEGKGVRIIPAHRLFKEYWQHRGRVWWHKLKGLDRTSIVDFYLQHWCDEYTTPLQFWSMVSPLRRLWRAVLHLSPKYHDDRWHCSEICSSALIAGGFKTDLEPVTISPGQVATFSCLQQGIEICPSDE